MQCCHHSVLCCPGVRCEQRITNWCVTNPCGIGAKCTNAPNNIAQQVPNEEILPFKCTACPAGQNIALGKCKNNGN